MKVFFLTSSLFFSSLLISSWLNSSLAVDALSRENAKNESSENQTPEGGFKPNKISQRSTRKNNQELWFAGGSKKNDVKVNLGSDPSGYSQKINSEEDGDEKSSKTELSDPPLVENAAVLNQKIRSIISSNDALETIRRNRAVEIIAIQERAIAQQQTIKNIELQRDSVSSVNLSDVSSIIQQDKLRQVREQVNRATKAEEVLRAQRRYN